MRKIIFVSSVILLFGCTKEVNSGKENTGGIEKLQTNNAGGSTYLPLTKGNYWQYKIKTDAEMPGTSTLTVLGIQKNINGKKYQSVKSVSDDGTDTLYYAQDQHDYYVYTYTGTSENDNVNLEILFLKDNVSVGDTWLIPAGTANGFNLKCYGKIIEDDASITVTGVKYDHVIHSYIEIRKPLLFTYIVVNRQDFYTAKNIGIIKNVSTVVLPVSSTTTTNITGYKIN